MGFHSKARVTKSRSIARVVAPPAPIIVSPTGASLVVQGGQLIAGGVLIAPTGAQLVAKGGTVVYGGVNARPTGASLILKGGTLSAWTPRDLGANLVAWYTADSITGKNDGDTLASWSDLSGNARHLTQGTGGSQPLYKTNIQNGKPCVKFDGSDDSMSVSFTTAYPRTIWIVFSYHATTAAVTNLCDGVANNTTGVFTLSGPGHLVAIGAGANADSGVSPSVGTFYYTTAIWPAASAVSCFVNGSGGTGGTGGSGTPTGLTVAAQAAGATNRAPIYIAELFTSNTAVDATTRQLGETYLKIRWGL